jgi:hypothetical protein
MRKVKRERFATAAKRIAKQEARSLMASYKIVKAEKINLTITVPYTFQEFRVCITEGEDFKKLVSHIEKGKMI